MGNSGWGLVWYVVIAVIPLSLLVRAFRSPTEHQMTRWASQADVTITADNEDMIRHRLGRARRYRSLVSLPFWWVLTLPLLTQEPLPRWLDGALWLPLTGYVLGSMLAAVAKPGEPGGVRTAELAPRLPSRYIPRRERVAPWVLLGTALTVFGLARAFPPKDQLYLGSPGLLFATAVAIAVLAEVALRIIANRPQVAGSQSRRSADDALRSTGATAAVASSIMMALFTLATAIWSLTSSGLRAWLGFVALLIYGMTYGVFRVIVTQQPWAPVWRRTIGTEGAGINEPGAASEPGSNSLPGGISA